MELDEQDKKTPLVITLQDGQLTANIHLLYKLFETTSAIPRPSAPTEHSHIVGNCAPVANIAVTDQTSLLSKQFLIISVVGPPSSGKSFLINWIARYLSTNGDDNWMAATGGDSVPLRGFSWNPFPDDLEIEGSFLAGATRGVRVLADLPKLYQFDTGEDGIGRVTKHAKVILLDVDMPNKRDPEFSKYYAALTASCVLISTLAIYIDGGGGGKVDEKELYNPRLVLALLDQVLSETDSSKPEILFMVNQHFSPSARVFPDSSEEFQQFCAAYEVHFTDYKLHTLRKLNRRGQFLGALEHMNKPQLHLALSRMASVHGLLSKPTQTPPDIIVLIQKAFGKINETLKPDVWADFTKNLLEYMHTSPSQVVEMEIPEHKEDFVQTHIAAATELTPQIIPTAAPRPSLHQHLGAGTLSLPAKITQQTELYPTTDANCSKGVGTHDSPELDPKREAVQTEKNVQQAEAPNPTAEEENDTTALPAENANVKNPDPDPLTETNCDQLTFAEAHESIKEHTCKESENIEKKIGKRDETIVQDQHSEQTVSPIKQSEVPDDNDERQMQNETKQKVEAYMVKNAIPVFERLLQHNLHNYLASSMVRLDVVEQIGVFIIDKIFDSKPHPYREYATKYFTGLLTVLMEERSYITEAIDKGRNLIDSEFESDCYFTDEGLAMLVARAKTFSSNGFKPKSEQHAKFFDDCWTAMEQNAKDRNKRLREHEASLNEQAISCVLDLYSEEILQFMNTTESDVNCKNPKRHMLDLNEKLVNDCLNVLSGMKNYRGETEKVKAKLAERMAEFYSDNIETRVKASIVQESEQRNGRDVEDEIQSSSTRRTSIELQTANSIAVYRNQEVQETKTANNASSLRPFATPASSSYTTRFTTGSSGENSKSKVLAIIPPITRESISDSAQPQPLPATSIPSTSANVHDASLLVIHLGRDSIVRVVPVGKPGQDYPVQKIPAFVGVVDGEFAFGEDVMNLPTAIRLQEHCAGHHRLTMLIGKNVHQLRYELLLGLFFAKCKEKVEFETGLNFNTCILAVPAIRTIVESEAIRDAAHVAGFKSIRLISELTAVAFDHHQQIHSAILDKRVTRSNSKSRILVLYCASNGVKEMSLHNLSFTDPQVEMMAVTGTPFLGHISSTANWTGWGRTPSEYQKFTSEVTGAANVNLHTDSVKLILAGDNHDSVQQSAGMLDIQKIHGCSLTGLTDESVIHGAMGLAKCMQTGKKIGVLAVDKVGIPVRILLPSVFRTTYYTLFEKNADMPGKTAIALPLTSSAHTEFIFRLVNIELGLQMGSYTIQMKYPAAFPTPLCTYAVKCTFTISYNGIIRIEAQLRERGPHGTKYFPLDVERTDSLNLNGDEFDKCKCYVAHYMPTDSDGKAKHKVRKELRKSLEDIKNHLKELKSHRGGAWQTKSLEGEIYRAAKTIEDSSTDLETLRALFLTFRKIKLSPPSEGFTEF